MPHGERSCGNSAVLIVVSPGGGAAAGVGAFALGAPPFAGLDSAAGATPLVAGGCAVGDVAAGAGGASAGAGIDGLAAVAAGAATGGDGSGNGAAGVVAGVCAAAVGRGAAWAGARGRTGAKVLVCADAEWANAISGRNAASIANVLKRNCKAHFDADRTTRRPPWLHQSSVCMSHPPKAPRTRRHGPRICPANDAILGPCAVMVAEAHLRIEGCHVQRASRNRRSDAARRETPHARRGPAHRRQLRRAAGAGGEARLDFSERLVLLSQKVAGDCHWESVIEGDSHFSI
jgi:hypothetical protein